MAHIVVGLSGGVDSAVTAYLLKQQGHRVTGIFMKNWEGDDNDPNCPARQDFLDVLAIGDALGIEVDLVNFAAEYRERVFAYFLAEYQAGRTPNPDVLCNAEIKFKAFLAHAMEMGADHIATGHYARLADVADAWVGTRPALTGGRGGRQLLKAVDANKDQSYFLYRLTQAQIGPALFPLGELTKPEVRVIARDIALPVANKKDSTGICFIGERDFRDFLKRYLPTTPGPMETPEGRVVGQHEGLAYYTLGQRQGLRIGGIKGAPEGVPWFVAGKDMAANRLIVVQGHEHPLLRSRDLTASQLNWIGAVPVVGQPYTAKTRYRQTDAPCVIMGLEGDRLQLAFAEDQWAVTPGQSVVLYEGEVCLGGGVIE